MVKAAIAFSFVLALMFLGYRGRQQARIQFALEEITAVSNELQQKLDIRMPEPPAGAIRKLTKPASQPLEAEVKTLAGTLTMQFKVFDSHYGTRSLSEFQKLELQLSRATLANAQNRYVDALAAVREEDEKKLIVTRAHADQSIRVLQVRGEAFYGLHQWEQALERYRQIQNRRPERISAMTRAADCEYELGRLEQALSKYNELARIHNNRANALLIRGKADAALAHYDKAVEIQTALAELERRDELRNNLGLILNNAGTVHLVQGKFDLANGNFEKAIELQSRLVEQQWQSQFARDLAKSYNNAGTALLAQGQLEAALGHYEKALEIQTRLPELDMGDDRGVSHNNLGNVFLGRGTPDAALGHYDSSIEIRTRLVEQQGRSELAHDLALGHSNRGVAHRLVGKLDLATRDFESAAAILTRLIEQTKTSELPEPAVASPNKPGIHSAPRVTLDVSMVYSGRAPELLTAMRLIGQKPGSEVEIALATSLKNCGYVYQVQGKWAEAIRHFERAAEVYAKLVEQEGQRHLAIQFSKCLSPLAWILASSPDDLLRDGQKAKAYASKACELSQYKASHSLEALAAACAETSDFAEAITWQQKAIELVPGKEQAELRSRLELYRSAKRFRLPLP
jgi:tetratricopeptide (TPR) repeat protein